MLISLGLDFGFAPIDIRERFHRSENEVRELYATPGVHVPEVAFVTTCNRLEVYGWVSEAGDLADAFYEMAARWAQEPEECRAFLRLCRRRTGEEAARHLLRVASGLESQVLGDIHILGQLRKSFRLATEAEGLGPHLQRLFDAAFRAGKAVRRETDLMAGRSSVGSEAAGLASRAVRGVASPRFVVVGCGKVGSHAAHSLHERKEGTLVLMNRTRWRAEELAAEVRAEVVDWNDRYAELAAADVVIVATGAAKPVVALEELARARAEAGTTGRPLLVVDVAMPRNVAGDRSQADAGISLLDLDALEPETASVERARQASVPQAQELVEAEVDALFSWLAGEPARQALRPLQQALADICLREIAYAADDAVAQRTAGRIVAKLLAGPMGQLQRECREGRSVAEVARTVSTLFDLPAAEDVRTHAV